MPDRMCRSSLWSLKAGHGAMMESCPMIADGFKTVFGGKACTPATAGYLCGVVSILVGADCCRTVACRAVARGRPP